MTPRSPDPQGERGRLGPYIGGLGAACWALLAKFLELRPSWLALACAATACGVLWLGRTAAQLADSPGHWRFPELRPFIAADVAFATSWVVSTWLSFASGAYLLWGVFLVSTGVGALWSAVGHAKTMRRSCAVPTSLAIAMRFHGTQEDLKFTWLEPLGRTLGEKVPYGRASLYANFVTCAVVALGATSIGVLAFPNDEALKGVGSVGERVEGAGGSAAAALSDAAVSHSAPGQDSTAKGQEGDWSYERQCVGYPEPGGDAGPAYRPLFVTAMLGEGVGIGATQGGCLDNPMWMPRRNDGMYAVGYCDKQLRSLIVVTPDGHVSAVLGGAAVIAKRLADDQLLQASSPRIHVDRGDMYIFSTAGGVVVALRSVSSLPGAEEERRPRWCGGIPRDAVGYLALGPRQVGAWLEVQRREGRAVWPVLDRNAQNRTAMLRFRPDGHDELLSDAYCNAGRCRVGGRVYDHPRRELRSQEIYGDLPLGVRPEVCVETQPSACR